MYQIKNEKWQKYLANEFNPAMQFAHSEEGIAFIRVKIPSLDKLRNREQEVMAAVYVIIINSVPVYIGESCRTVKRLYCHAHNLWRDSYKYFGLYPEEIKTVEMIISTPPLLAMGTRQACEEAMIRSMRPALQPYYNIPGMRYDTCLPRGQARREAMIRAGVIKEKEG